MRTSKIDRREFLAAGAELAAAGAAVSGASARPQPNTVEDSAIPPFFEPSALIEGSYHIIPTAPIAVGNVRQLLMDKHVVDTTWNCFRTVHQPEKFSGNPLIAAPESEQPFKTKLLAGQGTVIYDANLKRFRYWSRSNNPGRPKWDKNQVQIYYESQDGIHWVAPKLGIVDLNDGAANNMIRGDAEFGYDDPCVLVVPPRLSSRGRFAMIYGAVQARVPPGAQTGNQNRIAWSEDGIHWKDQTENPVMRGRNDCFCNMVYNPERDVFMMYRRTTVNPHEVRRIAYSESKDLISWTQPELIVDCDELDPPHLYGMGVSTYQGVYLGLLEMWYLGYDAYAHKTHLYGDGRQPKDNKVDIQLAWSRDGKLWERHPQRPIFLENGLRLTATNYDWGMIWPCQGMIERDDKIHIYYRSDACLHMSMPGSWGNFCLATLRRDGFVSLGSPGDGYMLTKPLLCPGGKLHINASAAGDGFVKVAVRKGAGEHDGVYLPEMNIEKGRPFGGDSVDAVMDWSDQRAFNELKGQSIRLEIWLHKAELYSFWFD